MPASRCASLLSSAAIRSITASGTTTPGTSVRMNSAFRRLVRGQIPAITGTFKWAILSRKTNSASGANTGCVMMNSAPASTFSQVRRYSRSRSIAFGSAPTPITIFVTAFNGLPPRSTP